MKDDGGVSLPSEAVEHALWNPVVLRVLTLVVALVPSSINVPHKRR